MTASEHWAVLTYKDDAPHKVVGVSGVFLEKRDAQYLAAATCCMEGYHVKVVSIILPKVEGDLVERAEWLLLGSKKKKKSGPMRLTP